MVSLDNTKALLFGVLSSKVPLNMSQFPTGVTAVPCKRYARGSARLLADKPVNHGLLSNVFLPLSQIDY